MGSKRVWLVRGFDTDAVFAKNVGNSFESIPGVVKQIVPSERKAVERLLIDPVMRTMSPVVRTTPETANSENIVGYYVNVVIPVNSYDELRSLRKDIIFAVNQWAEKSRVSGNRGFRANAVKSPVIERNREGTYSLKFNVLFSNTIFYSSKTWRSNAHSATTEAEDFKSLETFVRGATGKPVIVKHKPV